MKTARELMGDDFHDYIEGGIPVREMFELVAQRARQEALEMAARTAEDGACSVICGHERHSAQKAAAARIRKLPTTPGDGEAGR